MSWAPCRVGLPHSPAICASDAAPVKRTARAFTRAIARHNGGMELSSRIDLMNWLVGQGLTGLPEPDLIRGFCERCCAGGLGSVAR